MTRRGEASKGDFQRRVTAWLVACFGEERAIDPLERTYRMLEEALELAQACGCAEEDASRLVRYVFSRPRGGVPQEVGGVMVTVAGLCSAMGVDMMASGDDELVRDWARIDEIRLKANSKPDDTPLPQ